MNVERIIGDFRRGAAEVRASRHVNVERIGRVRLTAWTRRTWRHEAAEIDAYRAKEGPMIAHAEAIILEAIACEASPGALVELSCSVIGRLAEEFDPEYRDRLEAMIDALEEAAATPWGALA